MTSPAALPIWEIFSAIRQRGPLVHNITNYVAMEISANVLLAAGASPAMIHAVEEAGDFAGISSAVVINIGTLSAPWVEGMHAAMAAAQAKGVPTVLDPVGVGATAYRTQVAVDLLAHRPTVIRGNASEIMALASAAGAEASGAEASGAEAGGAEAGGKGVDSTHSTNEALSAAKALARHTGAVVAVTGAVDRITDGERVIGVENGHPLMTRITAMGCSLSGLVGACLAVHPDPLEATAAALAVYGLAGELAAARAEGPGSLKTHLLDLLHTLDAETIQGGSRIQ